MTAVAAARHHSAILPFRMCEILHAAEFHHFSHRGDILLFDVSTLSVIESCALDRVLLDAAAAHECSAADLLNRATVNGFDPLGARLRLGVLREQRFLLACDEAPRRIGVAATMRGDVSAKVFRILASAAAGTEAHDDCRACWSRNLCAGGPASECAAMRAESEAAIALYAHHSRNGLSRLYPLAE